MSIKVTLSWSEEAWENFQYWLDNDKPKARKLIKTVKVLTTGTFMR